MGTVYGVGTNDAGYAIQVMESVRGANGKPKQRIIWFCPFYRRWVHMLERCYSERYQEKKPTYIGCTVCEEWLRFSNFKSWMETQDWEGKHLDKDLLVEGNKIYSPDTCILVYLSQMLLTHSLQTARQSEGIGQLVFNGIKRIGSLWHGAVIPSQVGKSI